MLHERDRGGWPSTLEDLVPPYLSEVPPALAAPVVVEFDFGERSLRVLESASASPWHEWTLPASVR